MSGRRRKSENGGKVIVIDGGFSKTYRRRTGIAGYTLTYNPTGFHLPHIKHLYQVKPGDSRRDRYCFKTRSG